MKVLGVILQVSVLVLVIGCPVAGAVLGAVIWWPRAILPAIGVALLGGVAGLFVGLNVFCAIEGIVAAVLRGFTRRDGGAKKARS
jgi:hypothetical protein